MRASFLICAVAVLPWPAAAAPAASAAAAERAAEAAEIAQTLRAATFEERKHGYVALRFSGITDKAPFAAIHDRLMELYKTPGSGHDKASVAELVQIVEALATSGNDAYRKDIQTVADSPRVDDKARDHAHRALELLQSYAQWNTIIDKPRPGMSWPHARVENLLSADEVELKREGLRRVKELGPTDPSVYDGVERELDRLLAAPDLDQPDVENTAAYMCKYLAMSGNPKYVPTLDKAVASGHKRLVKHCGADTRKRLKSAKDDD